MYCQVQLRKANSKCIDKAEFFEQQNVKRKKRRERDEQDKI